MDKNVECIQVKENEQQSDEITDSEQLSLFERPKEIVEISGYEKKYVIILTVLFFV